MQCISVKNSSAPSLAQSSIGQLDRKKSVKIVNKGEIRQRSSQIGEIFFVSKRFINDGIDFVTR